MNRLNIFKLAVEIVENMNPNHGAVITKMEINYIESVFKLANKMKQFIEEDKFDANRD